MATPHGSFLKQHLSLISDVLSSSKGNNNLELCDLCYRAKQTRSSFPQGDNIVNDCCELIHYDF